ncbi:MAG TPA: DM13 domain-containing protein [Frankiaceae bacterium]|nr:DM13 domain-containing protein [Frankiaceae bacterium]
MRAFVRRHVAAVSVLAVLAVAGAVFVAVWFQPQKLFLDKTVNDALPAGAEDVTATPSGSAAPTSAGATPAAPRATVLSRSMLGDRAHHASGTVRVLRLADGARVLRLEGLDVENGPDLYVTLAAAAPDAPNGAYDSDYVSLGRLKGNKGDQTYAVPGSVDLTRYKSVVIWCKRFSVAFGTAPLTA